VGLICASVTVSALPVVIAYFAPSRQFIVGLTAGSAKGWLYTGIGQLVEVREQ
jgi:hypothetical protein